MQEDVNNISAWLGLNKLTSNVSKSGTMLVESRQKLRGESELNVSIDNEALFNFKEASLSLSLSLSNK